MPQLPTSTAEEYGAEDEIKLYNQEEDECSDSSTVDVVNDIKDDLLNEDENHSAKTHEESLYRGHGNSSRYLKGESNQGLYGSPAAVIVGPQRYYDHAFRPATSSHGSMHGNSYSGTQIRMPMYNRGEDRGYYEQGGPWPPTQVNMPPHYPHGYGSGTFPPKYGIRYPPGIPHGAPYYLTGHSYPGMPGRPPKEPKRPHVKKPLNAFMLYMKEQRPKIAAEFTLKESAAINQILGKRWHALDKSEQAKYYEMARKERALHMQMYPGWSARDNYAQIGRKKKRPRDKNEEMNPKKCRARYGLDRQEQWCKPCRRKKKCVRFLVGADGETREVPEKDQPEQSDSDDNNSVQIKTENLTEHPEAQTEVTDDMKEKFQELVNNTTSNMLLSIPSSVSQHEPQTLDTMQISNTNNNNNNNNTSKSTLLSPQSTLVTTQSSQINKSYTDFNLQSSINPATKTQTARNTALPPHYNDSTVTDYNNPVPAFPSDDKSSIQQNLETLKTVTATCS